jgi:asparagine synthase (glutamine-hydrolysing)
LRGPLRSWADGLLDPDRLVAEGYLDSGAVQRCWREHSSGRRDHRHRLWAVLMFEAWLEATQRRAALA